MESNDNEKTSVDEILRSMEKKPEYHRSGMILVHRGVVRETDREGRKVTSLKVFVDRDRLAGILREHREDPGILDLQIRIREKRTLHVGDEVMTLVVMGDIRDHVLKTMERVLHRVKTEATRKEQHYIDSSQG